MTAAPQHVPPKEITWDEYLAEFVNEPPTLQPYEIIDGVRIFRDTPTWRQRRIAGKISGLLDAYEVQSGKGFCVFSPFDVMIQRMPKVQTRQPDVFFITHEQLERGGGIPAMGPLQVAPELVVEVLS